MNPLTALRKLGIAIVGKDGLLDTGVAYQYGIGPMAKIKLQEEAQAKAAEEQMTRIKLQQGALGIDKSRQDLTKGEFDLSQDRINAPLLTESHRLANEGQQTRNTGSVLDNASKGADLRKKQQEEEEDKQSAEIIAREMKIPVEQAHATVRAYKDLFAAGNARKNKETGALELFDPSVEAEDRMDKRNNASIANFNRIADRQAEANRTRNRAFGFKTVQEINKIAQQIKTSTRFKEDTATGIKVQDMERAFNRFASSPGFDSQGGVATQIVVNNFNKILDPSSVVREGEYARSTESLAATDRVRGFISNLEKGAPIPINVLRQYVADAKLIAKAAQERRQETVRDFKLQIKMLPGIDDDTIEEAAQANFGSVQSSTGPSLAVQRAMKLKGSN